MRSHLAQKALYNGLILPLGTAIGYAVSPFHRKMREALRGRRGFRTRWQQMAGMLGSRPVWFHISSVGEFEQARPLISALGGDFPQLPIVITFLSPSGYRFARRKETLDQRNNIKFIDYLPADSVKNTRFCLRTLNPRLLAFIKFDLWPNLIWQARRAAIPSVLIDGTLSASSQRWSPLGRLFYGAVYEDLTKILAIGEGDARRFRACAPRHSAITVCGDTRFDRVAERKHRPIPVDIDFRRNGSTVIVAGSTWPKDESQILDALARLLKERQDVRLIIAPHEPSTERVSCLTSWASLHGFDAVTLGESGSTPHQVTVVDSVGILAELYRFADVAYIGGSFSTGVHSVIEPAIMGIPVLFGPVHENSLEALELLKRGAAAALRSPEEIHERLSTLVSDENRRRSMGKAAEAYVESQLGATARCLKAIAEYL